MSQLNKTQLENVNQTNFPNNNTQFITPTKLREFNTDMIDSLVDESSYTIDSASFSASIATLTSGSSVNVAEEGMILGPANTFNFVGATVTASLSMGVATINVNASAVDLSALNQFSQSINTYTGSMNQFTQSINQYTSSNNQFSASVANEINSLQDVTASFTTTASFNSYTSSNDAKVQALINVTGSYASTSSLNSLSSSLSTRLTADEQQILNNAFAIQDLTAKTGSYATTGSNTFNGNQTINGSLNVSGDITASKLLVQIETASIIYSSGSNQLGDDLSDIQTLFGRVIVTGSLNVSQSLTASLTEGYAWIGGVGNITQLVPTSSFIAIGTSGTSGINGTNGTGGTSGINGTNGSAGTSGINGTSGIDGTNGTGGTSGINGTNGTGGTSGIDGTNGSAGTSGIDGTNGSAGTSGINGTNGSGGTSGIDGTNGTGGTSGIDGTNGSAGTSGVNGTSGINGTNGSGGTSGVDGTSGINGTNGTGGTSGVNGTSGVSGTSGINGTSGIDGTNGSAGTSGLNGTSGVDGTSGINGTSGVNGTNGSDGTSGLSGTNGTAGTSGTSGQNGQASGRTYFFNGSVTGSVSGSVYRQLDDDPVIASYYIVSQSLSGSGTAQLLASYITEPLGFTLIPGGLQTFHLNMLKPASNDNIQSQVSLQLSDVFGTPSGSLLTSSFFEVGWNGPTTPISSILDFVFPTTTIDSSSRMIVKVFAKNNDAVPHDIQFWTQGDQFSFVVTSVGLENGTSGTSGTSGTGGSSGINGTNGSGGTSGIDGTNGTGGTSGIDGTNGSAGTSGINGTNGSGGTSGIDGTNGTAGSGGTSGVDGTNGTAGSGGTSGINGTNGTAGSGGTSGVDGTNGTAGSGGTSGIDGTNGTAGSGGTSGVSGTSGVDGTSGVNGTSGVSGTSGTSATFGNKQQNNVVYISGSNLVPTSATSLTVIDEGVFSYLYMDGNITASKNILASGSFTASLQQGYVWAGQAGNYSRAVATSSLSVASASVAISSSFSSTASFVASASYALSSSYSLTASFALNAGTTDFPYTGSAIISGALLITGSISVTGSNYLRSGSNSGSWINNLTDTYTNVPRADYIVTLDSASYAALGTKDPNTLYVVSGSGATGGGTGVGFPFSGSALITGSLGVTGSISVSGSYLITSQSFTGSLVDNVTPSSTGAPVVKHVISITSASYAALATKDPNTLYIVSGSAANLVSQFPFTGSAIISGSLTITGSAQGNIVAVSVASNTASIDLNAGNFFTVTLANNATTHFNLTNLNAGETANIFVTTGTVSTASFSTNVRQPSGSFYLPSSGSNVTDLLSIAVLNSTTAYLVNAKRFI